MLSVLRGHSAKGGDFFFLNHGKIKITENVPLLNVQFSSKYIHFYCAASLQNSFNLAKLNRIIEL